MSAAARPVFVTGATGYIGGRLVPRLLAAGHRVRCFVRSPEKLAGRALTASPNVEVVAGDAADGPALAAALRGCGAAYYLVHSMAAAGPAYSGRDLQLARTFAEAAAEARLARVIYLGGLGEVGDDLSRHLRSRREVGEALAAGPVPVTTLRAAMIIGSGSASFEILRYLVERLPVMVTPRWVHTEFQPIAVRDALHYLVQCLETPATVGTTLDIGGADVLTYREAMLLMARALGLRPRLVVPLPVLTPRLSALWIHLVTPISKDVARPLAEGLRNRVVCRDDTARRLMPRALLTAREAIEAALSVRQENAVETAWSDAGVVQGDPDWAGGTTFVDRRTVRIPADAASVWEAVTAIGGERGYGAADWLWHARGVLDRVAGGPGLRRGRRHPARLGYGEALDFWRVAAVEPSRRLALRAEMKLPGEALLEFDLQEHEGSTLLTQCARFKPRGLAGLAYWAAVWPLHWFVFESLLRQIRADACAPARAAGAGPAARPAPDRRRAS